MAGWSGYGVGDEEDWATIAYDAATGAQLWRQRLKGPGSSTDSPESAAVSPDGSRLFVTGFMWPGIFEKYWTTVSYDTVTGALLWRRSHSGDGGSVVSSSTGSTVYVAGSGAGERALVAYDGATGAVAWIAQDAGGYSWGRLAISPDSSRLFVKTAVYTPAGDSDVLVAAYAA